MVREPAEGCPVSRVVDGDFSLQIRQINEFRGRTFDATDPFDWNGTSRVSPRSLFVTEPHSGQ